MNRLLLGRTLILFTALSLPVAAWDHPGHMAGAAIAFEEIQRERPELVEKIGLLPLTHLYPAPFAVTVSQRSSPSGVSCLTSKPSTSA